MWEPLLNVGVSSHSGKMVSGISMTIVVEQFATIALITRRDAGNYGLVQIINILSGEL